MRTITVWPSGRSGYRFALRFGYDPDLVQAIKRNVPSYERTYDKRAREWHITAAAWPKVQRIAAQLGAVLIT